MLAALRIVAEPFEADYMRRALAAVLILGVLSGVVGVAVQLRGLSFMAESLTHTVFPGVAIAFFAGQSLLAGALVAALASVVLLSAVTRLPRIDDDALLGLLLASFFALGVIVVSRRPTFNADLTRLLFGRILTVTGHDLVSTAVVAAVAVVLLVGLRKELLFRAFDSEGTRAVGYPAFTLDLLLNVAVALTIVAAVRAIGTALVVAFVITPAATARLVCHRLSSMITCATLVACVTGFLGLGISYDASVHHDVRLGAGATIVVLLTAVFVVVSAGAALVRRRRRQVATA